MQAGESYDKQEAENYFNEHTRSSMEQSLNPSKKALGMFLENKEEPKVVNYKDRSDLWAHNVAALFDLKDKSLDIRFVARDENISFKMFTDDFYAIFLSQDKLSKEEIKEYYENHLKELTHYDAIFDFAKYCLALPYYVFENEQRIVDVTYETKLKSIIKSPVSKKEFASVPTEYKVYAKPLYYLESSDPAVITKVQQVELFNNENAGYIYIMRQPIHEENIFKIGLTRRSSEQRSKELSNTSSADKFFIINSYHTKDCIEAEKQIHKELESYRLTS